MVLRAIMRATLQENVFEQIYAAILSNRIAPGTRLTLRKLAEDLNVSVQPVREAIRQLEARNFLTVQSNKQIFVNELSFEHFHQILDARILLEGYVAREASIKRSEQAIKEMEETMGRLQETQDKETILVQNRLFHRTMYKEANLPVFLELIDALWERVSPYFYMFPKDGFYLRDKLFMKNHMGILEGMRQKKPAVVYKWLKCDLMEATEVLFPSLNLKTSASNKE
jgi:DNA-binding GntR family transcriptional regulator